MNNTELTSASIRSIERRDAMTALLVSLGALIAMLLALVLLFLAEGSAAPPVSRGFVRFAAGGTAVVSAVTAVVGLLSALSD